MATKTLTAKEMKTTKTTAKSKSTTVKTTIAAFGQKFNFTFDKFPKCSNVTLDHDGVTVSKNVVFCYAGIEFLCEDGFKYKFDFEFSFGGEIKFITVTKLEDWEIDDDELGHVWRWFAVDSKKFFF